ncbi:MAG: divalent-cation tolerance protein CutA [Pseudomonadota bacterium]
MMTKPTEVQVVLCTCPDEETACALATTIVSERLAACANVLPAITSIYRWEGEVQQDPEALLIIKSTAAAFPALRDAIVAAHPYELPEVVAVPVGDGLEGYLGWVRSAVHPG